MKAESERGLYLDCSISQIPEMSPSVCCTLLFSFGIIKFTGGGGGGGVGRLHIHLVKRGFQLRMEIFRLRENCLREPLSGRTDM